MDITYKFYTDEYLGTLISDEEEFLSMALKAEFYINEITFGNIEEFSYEVCLAVCAVCDAIKNDTGNIASENNDGYSVSYRQNKNLLAEIYGAAKLYLPDEFLYKGI